MRVDGYPHRIGVEIQGEALDARRASLGRVLINRQPNADLDARPNFCYWV